MARKIGDFCCWCMQKEERRKNLIFTEREGGKLVDYLNKYTALSSNDYESNWLCRPCFLLLQSCVAAESRFNSCKAKFLRSRNIDSVESEDVVYVKRCRPLMESPSSQPSQSAKVPKVSRSPPMRKTVKQMARKKLFADAEDYTGVKIEIHYQSKTIKKDVPTEYQSLCKAIVRGSKKTVASALLKSPAHDEVVSLVCRDLENECRFLSSRRCEKDSPFTSYHIHKFSIINVAKYLQLNCPFLYKILSQCSKSSTFNPTTLTENRQLASAVVAACILMNGRNTSQNSLQSIIANILHAGHAHKMIYTRLNHLAISVSYSSVLRLLDRLGKDHDIILRKWQQQLNDIIRVSCETNCDRDASCLSRSAVIAQSSEDTVQVEHQCLTSPMLEHSYAAASQTVVNKYITNQAVLEFKCPPKLMQLCMKVLNIRGFKLIGDNVDFYKHVRDMRHDHQNKSIHWFHLYAVLDRVPSCHLDDTHSQQSLSSVPNCNFLLGSDELEKMRKCMGILVSRVLIENMSVFQGFSSLVTWHIEHKHSEEMKMKSIQVWLGLQFKNEQIGEDAVDICKYVQQFVPGTGFSGDQLTVERVRSSVNAMCDSHTESQRLEGIVATIEDWHAKQCFLQVIWHMLYTEDSAADQCTLYQLRNLINRRNVPKDPKQDVNATEDFLQLVTDAHIVAAAGKELGSQDGNTIPESAFQHVGQLSIDEKRAYLMKISLSIVDNYMLPLSPCASLASSDSEEQDYVLNYAKILLTLGMIHRYFCDSVREGDGDRVLMCWKMLLLLFKQDGRTKWHTSYDGEDLSTKKVAKETICLVTFV